MKPCSSSIILYNSISISITQHHHTNNNPYIYYISTPKSTDKSTHLYRYADDSFTHYGCYTKFCYEKVYDEYMVAAAEHWTTKVPYMTTPGNHEAECHSPACLFSKERRENLSNFTAYNERFKMPSAESGGVLNMHYSFNYRNVHFISIDTETGYPDAPEAKRMVLKCGGVSFVLFWV